MSQPSWYDSARLLAQLKGETSPNQGMLKTELENQNVDHSKNSHMITVSETGEASLLPDVAKVFVTYKSIKDTVDAAKHSVQRRIDYILQTLRNNAIKDNHFSMHKNLERCDENFQMTAEFCIEFHDFKTCEHVCNYLVEKLDESVTVSKPVFCHSPGKLESLRRQACLNAIKNARTKAVAISQFLNQKLGSAVDVKEEEISEITGAPSTDHALPDLNIKRRIEAATVNVIVKISASFEIEPKTKKKHR